MLIMFLLIRGMSMKNYDYSEIFKNRIDNLEFDDEENPLSLRHKFLKMAVFETGGTFDPEIGNFEIPARKIKIDGYYDDEDEKIFHILSLIYFDEHEISEEEFVDEYNKNMLFITNFIFQALSINNSSLLTTSTTYEACMAFKDAKDNGYSFVIDFYSNFDFPEINDFPTSTFNGVAVNKTYFGASEIYESIISNDSSKLVIDLKKDYSTCLYGIKIASTRDFDVYSTSISGRLLAKIYNNHKSRLLEGNVRSYLKRTQKVNSGIVRTLQTIPSEFVAYNNGLSTVASLDGSVIKSLKGDFVEIEALNQLQIVNGGQTTVTIFECSRDPIDLSEVVVPMKLTILKRRENEAEMVSNISRYANTQTAIAKSDLSSNEPFYKEMQKYSRTIPCYKDNVVAPINEYYWFFERSNGQYNTERRVIYNYSKSFSKKYPEKLKFSKKILAKAIMAYERKPDIVCLGNEKNFVEFNEYVIENSIIPNEEYFKKFIAVLILWRSADKIILKDKLPIKAAVLPYTIAKLSHHSMKMINLSKIWKEQKIDSNLEFLILDIARKVSAYFQSVLGEHPNTLMWGRKPECWEAVKKIPYNIAQLDTEQAFDFMPSNPVIKFIEKKENLNNYSLWNRVLLWNSKNKVLSPQQEKYIQEAMMDIRYSMRISTVVKERKVKELFLKAVRNGFPYRD